MLTSQLEVELSAILFQAGTPVSWVMLIQRQGLQLRLSQCVNQRVASAPLHPLHLPAQPAAQVHKLYPQKEESGVKVVAAHCPLQQKADRATLGQAHTKYTSNCSFCLDSKGSCRGQG